MKIRPVLVAQKVISDLFIQNPADLDLEGIINFYDSYYLEKPMSGADGRIIFKGSKIIVTINSEITYPAKKRFVIAHELGHLMLHRNAVPIFNCDESAFMDWYQESSFEAQANEFAAEILMPQSLFVQEARKTRKFDFNLIKALATFFQTSITSTWRNSILDFLSLGYDTHGSSGDVPPNAFFREGAYAVCS